MSTLLYTSAYILVHAYSAPALSGHGYSESNKLWSVPFSKISAPELPSGNGTEEDSEEYKRRMKFFPIGLKCPKEIGNGILEIIKLNENGSRYRGRFYIKNAIIYRVSLELSMYKKPFEVLKDLPLSPSLNEEDKKFARNAFTKIDPVREVVCEGKEEERKRYNLYLKSNLTVLRRLLKDNGIEHFP